MTGQRCNDFRTQTRLNLDPNEHVIFIYDGAPAHNNPAIPGPNSELKKLPPYILPVSQHRGGSNKCLKSSHNSKAARTDEQQSRGKTTRERIRQFPHSVATSGPSKKHWHYHGYYTFCCSLPENILSFMPKVISIM